MRVDIFLFDGVTALDAVGPYEALSRLPDVEVRFCALEPGLVRTGNGFLSLLAEHSILSAEPREVMVFPGGDVAKIKALIEDQRLLDTIRDLHLHTTYTASVCTGALFLGAAGVLQGLKVATHWRAQALLPAFGAEYSGERVSRSGKLITSAGVSAGIEAGLVLCGLIAGKSLGAAVELSMEYSPAAPFGGTAPADASDALINLVKTRLR